MRCLCFSQVGIQTKEGVILAVEKRLTSTLLEPSSVVKVLPLSLYLVQELMDGRNNSTFNISDRNSDVISSFCVDHGD